MACSCPLGSGTELALFIGDLNSAPPAAWLPWGQAEAPWPALLLWSAREELMAMASCISSSSASATSALPVSHSPASVSLVMRLLTCREEVGCFCRGTCDDCALP